ncbi:site-specific recombinase, phage integrase family [Acetobacteraceae bacterium AT-5844]|nr:site-specific recombinase, phage integrase family [Acetobacteraceae bacterium AT-5844]
MPLRITRRKGSSFFWLVGTIEGRRIRESTGTDNPEHAEIKRAAREAELFKAAIAGIRPSISFAKAAASYLSAEKPGPTHIRSVNRLVSVLGSVLVRDIGQIHCDQARRALLKKDAKATTIARHVVAPLTSILRHASRRKYCEWPRLEWPKQERTEFSFFLPHQAEALISAASPHLQPIIIFLLCTGVRIGEAIDLEWRNVDLAGRKVILWEGTTKSRRRRVVHLNPRAVASLTALPGREGRVFRRDDGEPYMQTASIRSPIRTAWNSAAYRAGLPGKMQDRERNNGVGARFQPEHTPHDCRHTYASWHYALHKDLLLLVRDIGWKSVVMAERYAHVMPEGHREAICSFWGISDPILTQRKEDAA